MHPWNFARLVLCSLIHITPNISLSNLGALDVCSYNSNHCYANNHMRCYSKASLNGNCCSCLTEQITLVFLLCLVVIKHSIWHTVYWVNLQVWGLFAPKYVFDAIGLLLTDLLICLASIYYSWCCFASWVALLTTNSTAIMPLCESIAARDAIFFLTLLVTAVRPHTLSLVHS